uniref:Ovule protein n=1 Tax=Hydatigena taeniaeformis TaxID=6205 RepID=A0A0R3XC39_HYDTA
LRVRRRRTDSSILDKNYSGCALVPLSPLPTSRALPPVMTHWLVRRRHCHGLALIHAKLLSHAYEVCQTPAELPPYHYT